MISRRNRYAAPALEKGLDILELLASVSEPLTHSEIASRLGRTITEVFRMLVCLEERGYISRTGPDERYQLTLKLFEVVHQHHPLQRLIAQARPLVRRVASHIGQSCHLAMLNHAEVVVVAQFDAPGIMGFSVRMGANIDLLNTASGHVILAFQSDEVRARALGAWRFRSRRPIPSGLYRHLNQIRRRGFEELASYQVHGVVNISYPVLNQHGEAIAALTVPFLARIGDSVGPVQVKEALSVASRALSAAIGGKRLELSASAV
ncbi:MAG: IclR family transcriptional regulator [Candidatus Sulfotelmatobacter sp.]